MILVAAAAVVVVVAAAVVAVVAVVAVAVVAVVAVVVAVATTSKIIDRGWFCHIGCFSLTFAGRGLHDSAGSTWECGDMAVSLYAVRGISMFLGLLWAGNGWNPSWTGVQ